MSLDASTIDTIVAVVLAAALAVCGWVVVQLMALTAATASLTAQTVALASQVREIQDDHDERIQRLESSMWQRRQVDSPPRQQLPPRRKGTP
ncbi:MAG TPA: hypothetical protein VLS51_08560 [Propionibacteriaceae bacterium]|nr:hypothetical protein [Propionibacteriaceae bacterium]